MSTYISSRWAGSPWLRRVAEVALVALVTVLSVQEASVSAGGALLDPTIAVALVAGLSVAARRRWPLAVAAVTVIAAGGWHLTAPFLVALFHLAARGRTWEAAGGAVVALLLNALVDPAMVLWSTRSYGPVMLPASAVVLGLWAGNRRRLVDALASQVEHLRVERELRERAARLAERAAVAAEMHDVLAHRLSLIALHTGVLTTRKDKLPEPVAERVGLLRTASTEALADLRDVLGALRDPDRSPAGASTDPALREVDELVEQARAAGQRVEVDLDGHPERAPAVHRLAVFRLVQEALTNARKHAPAAPVHVRIRYGPPETLVDVTNAAAARPGDPVPSGFGLVGLRERVQALGGELRAGSHDDGAWRVSARIPHPPVGHQQNRSSA
ncbi:histidine kinase [Streptomyces sp. NPDC003077]|uniref:sensor histidine kinase n=1 Tax=Streptomyces sp. NPDC003077 TaxID=3154443 RepID=UPI0033A0A3A2